MWGRGGPFPVLNHQWPTVLPIGMLSRCWRRGSSPGAVAGPYRRALRSTAPRQAGHRQSRGGTHRERPCACNGFPGTKSLVGTTPPRLGAPTGTPPPAGKRHELSQTAGSGDGREAGIAPRLDSGRCRAGAGLGSALPGFRRPHSHRFGDRLGFFEAFQCPAGFLHCSGSYCMERKVPAARHGPRRRGRRRRTELRVSLPTAGEGEFFSPSPPHLPGDFTAA